MISISAVLFVTIVLGLITIILFLEINKLKKKFSLDRKTQEDRCYKLSFLREIQEKIIYTSDIEKIIEIIITDLRNFFDYSVISSIVVKKDNLVFSAYAQEQINSSYIKSVEKSMLSSLSRFIEKLPDKIDRKLYGVTVNDFVKTDFLSSFHIPLVINNKVIALIHLSSIKENLYKDKEMEDLYQIVGIAAKSLTDFNKALDAEKDTFSSLIKSMNDGIFMADNKNNLLLINDSACKILGLSQNDVNFFDISNVFANMNLGSKINKTIISNKIHCENGIQVNDKTLDIFINPIANGKASIILHDMTEYRKKEIMKEDMTHIMVHELRAPITTIKDSAELIISTKNLEENKKLMFLEMIHQQSKKILGEIGSILDSAKLDAGKLTLMKTKGNITKLIQDEMQTFMPQAERKNISLRFDLLTKNIPEIFYDTTRIAQVIDNLLSNSLKFTSDKGKIKVEVDYKAVPPKLDGISPMKEFLSLDKYIVVSISDNGIGIAKEQQKLLFSKYTQSANTPEKLAKLGTGLGLYVIKGVVEAHGGRVWVKSTPGQGTTFSFSLPAKDDSKTSYDAPKLARTVN